MKDLGTQKEQPARVPPNNLSEVSIPAAATAVTIAKEAKC
jgi:hypothetical protein